MSLRCATRAPAKRMLVFFEADCSTSILSTTKVKKIIGGGNKLEEGANVIVDFDNVDYEALVIKLHDDPTVLSQHENDFVRAQQFDDDDVGDSEDFNVADKENQPSKRLKLTPKQARKEVKPRKPKAKAKAQGKKIITIESEFTPMESLSPSNRSDPSTQKVENTPGCLKFLDPLEQVRVQRLLDSFMKGEAKEVATQTEPVTSSLGPSDYEAPTKMFDERYVQTEVDVPAPSCHCNDVLASLNLLHEKIDSISSSQVPKQAELSIHFEQFNNENTYEFVENDSPLLNPVLPLSPFPAINNAETTLQQDQLQSLSTSTSTIQSSFEVLPQPLSTSTTAFQSALEVQQFQPLSTGTSTIQSSFEVLPEPQPTIRGALFEEIFKESSSMGNYAKNLVFKLFARYELAGSNCAGVKGKKSLEKDQRMELIKEAVFKKYSIEDKKKSWSLCKKAIDTACRHLKPFQ